jgi:hypothetical protein
MLVTTIVAGFAGAGIGLLLRRLSRRRLPGGVVPVAAGIAMIAATVGQEYGWYDGVRSTMARDLVVVSTREQRTWYQPWTQLRPFVKGFIGYSPAEAVETAEGSDVWAVQLRIQERWQPQTVMPVLVDCGEARWTDLTPDMEMTEAGLPEEARWRPADPDFAIVEAVCGGRTATG